MKPKPSNKGKSGVREVKAWIYYWSDGNWQVISGKVPPQNVKKLGLKGFPCTITYKLPITKKVNKKGK